MDYLNCWLWIREIWNIWFTYCRSTAFICIYYCIYFSCYAMLVIIVIVIIEVTFLILFWKWIELTRSITIDSFFMSPSLSERNSTIFYCKIFAIMRFDFLNQSIMKPSNLIVSNTRHNIISSCPQLLITNQ